MITEKLKESLFAILVLLGVVALNVLVGKYFDYSDTVKISEKDKMFSKQALVVAGSGEKNWENIGLKVMDLYKDAGFEINGLSSEWQVWQWVDEYAELDLVNEKKWRQCIEKKNSPGTKYCSDQHWKYSDENSSWEIVNISFGKLID